MGKKTSKSYYTLEFKQSSAKLAVESDQAISQTAKDLGIKETTLYGWVAKYRPQPKQGMKAKDEAEQELKQLRKENARLKQERDILKKAMAYFAAEAV
jgi:transposase-like protein